MKIIKTELVYVPKDLCSNALVSRMSINDKDTITDTTILAMIDCFSIVRLPYLNLNVMFYEVDCMTITNNCTVSRTRSVLRKILLKGKNLVNYIYYRCSPHAMVTISDHVTRKSERAFQLDLTSILWHDIIAITNRFDSLNRRWVVMCLHCDLHVRNCGDIRNRQSCIVTHSSCNMSGELEAITIDNHVRRTRNYYQNIYKKVKTK